MCLGEGQSDGAGLEIHGIVGVVGLNSFWGPCESKDNAISKLLWVCCAFDLVEHGTKDHGEGQGGQRTDRG